MNRRLLLAAALGAAALPVTGLLSGSPATAVTSWTVDTLEAFADTLIPGAKRYSGDVAVAGVASGPGGAHAGYITLLTDPRTRLEPLLGGIADTLNARALAYAALHGIWVSPLRPAIVGLSYQHRSAVVADLFQPGNPDRKLWAVMALLVGLAFDGAAHRPTAQAVRDGHPGLLFLGFPQPDPDGLWRYPQFSYRRVLGSPHPNTTPEGNPS